MAPPSSYARPRSRPQARQASQRERSSAQPRGGRRIVRARRPPNGNAHININNNAAPPTSAAAAPFASPSAPMQMPFANGEEQQHQQQQQRNKIQFLASQSDNAKKDLSKRESLFNGNSVDRVATISLSQDIAYSSSQNRQNDGNNLAAPVDLFGVDNTAEQALEPTSLGVIENPRASGKNAAPSEFRALDEVDGADHVAYDEAVAAASAVVFADSNHDGVTGCTSATTNQSGTTANDEGRSNASIGANTNQDHLGTNDNRFDALFGDESSSENEADSESDDSHNRVANSNRFGLLMDDDSCSCSGSEDGNEFLPSGLNGDWRSDNDMHHRREMILHIVQLLKQKENASPEWLTKLPQMVKRLEVSLYQSAPSFEAYSDTSTLKTRLQQLAMEIAKKTQQANEGRSNANIGANTNQDHLGTNDNRFDALFGDESSGESEADSESDDSQNRMANSNRFGLLMDDDSCSGSENGNESDDSNSSNWKYSNNRFNLLVGHENSSESELSDSELTDEEESDDEDENIAKCAVCFLPDNQSNKWRRLLTLPCCGSEGKEQSSSTRFCAACILQQATVRPDSIARNEYGPWDSERREAPARKFYDNDIQTETRKVIGCPRCRDILVVNIKKLKKEDDESFACDCSDCKAEREEDWTNPTNAKSVSVRVPTLKERCRYAGKKVGIASILWRIAFHHHSFLPRVALSGGAGPGDSALDQLVSWGVIQKTRHDQVFRMNHGDQMELINLLDLHNIHTTKEYGKEESLILDLFVGMGCATLEFLMSFRIDQALRVANRFGFLALFFKEYIKPFPLPFWQEWVVTALNIFAFAMIVQFLCITAVYAGSSIGIGLTVCYLLRHSSNPKSIWWQLALGLFFTYRCIGFVYSSPSITWFGLVAPKPAIAIYNLFGGESISELAWAVCNVIFDAIVYFFLLLRDCGAISYAKSLLSV